MLDFNNQLRHWHGNLLLLLCGSSSQVMSQALRLAEMVTEKQTTRSTGGSSYRIAHGCINELYRPKAAGVIMHFHRLPLNRKPALNTWLQGRH